MATVVVVDYGASNLKSIVRGLERAGAIVTVARAPHEMEGAAGLVLPGVGAAGTAMHGLHARGLTAPLIAALAGGTPFLGVCLGMQLLFGEQEEDDAVGLGLLEGRGRRLRGVKVPHMGWNTVAATAHGRESGLLDALPDDPYAYFVHSYYVEVPPAAAGIVAATTTYGDPFVSAIAHQSLWGTQFHPEKSGAVGAQVLRNFVACCAARHAVDAALESTV